MGERERGRERVKLLCVYWEVRLLGHMAVLFWIFWGTIILFAVVAASIYDTTNSTEGFPFLHILDNTCNFLAFLVIASLKGVRWYLIVVLMYISLWWLVMLSMYLLAICMSYLENSLFRFSADFLIRLFSCSWVIWTLYIFWIYLLQISSPIQWVVFAFCWWVFGFFFTF